VTFLDRVREKLKDSHRQRFVDHFQGSDTQKVFAGLEVLAEDMDKLAAAPAGVGENGDGSEEHPFTRQFIGKCFKRHDSALSFGACERDDGFELTIDSAEGGRRHFAIAPDGSIRDLADEARRDQGISFTNSDGTIAYGDAATCSGCGNGFPPDSLKVTKTGQWCPECYTMKFPGAAARRGAKK